MMHEVESGIQHTLSSTLGFGHPSTPAGGAGGAMGAHAVNLAPVNAT